MALGIPIARTELQISLGICEGMAALCTRGLAHGALCSVNVEVLQAGRTWQDHLWYLEMNLPSRQQLSVTYCMPSKKLRSSF